MLRGVFLCFGLLKRLQDLVADGLGIGETLQTRRKRRKFVVAKVAVRYAGGQNQIVIGDWDVAKGVRGIDHLFRPIDANYLAEDDSSVGLFAENASNRRTDLAWSENRRRNLIEERLEKMVVATVDENDPRQCFAKCLCSRQAGETASNDENPRKTVGHRTNLTIQSLAALVCLTPESPQRYDKPPDYIKQINLGCALCL